MSISDDRPAVDGEQAEMLLNADQLGAIESLRSGENTFLTGVAGTGKTTGLNAFVEQLVQTGDRHSLALTASTGAAAVHIGGQTLHSWSGMGVDGRSAATIANSGFWREDVAPIIARTKRLVVDEVSMVDGRVLDTVSSLCQRAKWLAHMFSDSELPFGGIQTIFVGDMAQLAPVEEERNGFAFEAKAWAESNIKIHELRKVVRQADPVFVQLLQRVRDGDLDAASEALLLSRVKAYDPEEAEAVRLMTHNGQVDRINAFRLQSLPGQEFKARATDTGTSREDIAALDKHCLSPRDFWFKLGARVMFTKNDRGLRWVNGTLGTIVDVEHIGPHVRLDSGASYLVPETEWEIARYEDGKPKVVLASRKQYPLKLAYAITVHKSQGMTIDKVSVDLAHAFAPGQVYVALSRARTLAGLNIESWAGPHSIKTSDKVKAFMAKVRSS